MMGKSKLVAALLTTVCGVWPAALGITVEEPALANYADPPLVGDLQHGWSKLVRREKFAHGAASYLEMFEAQEEEEEDPDARSEAVVEVQNDAHSHSHMQEPSSGNKAFVEQAEMAKYVYRSLKPVGWLPQVAAQVDRKPPTAPPLEQVCLVSSEKVNPSDFLASAAFHQQVQQGRHLVSGKRIVFAGLWRQIGQQAATQMFDALSSLGSYFRDYQLIMLENDSVDDTRKGIQAKCAQAERAWCFILDGVGNKVLHAGAPHRIVGLTALRQTLLMKVREFDKAGIFDYVMMIDGDIYAHGNGGFNVAGALAAFTLTQPETQNADGVCAYQVAGRSTRYYDTFAHIGPDCQYTDLKVNPSCTAASCGGGMVVYSAAALRQSQCNYVYVNEATCEHKPFNSCLANHNHSRIFIYKPWTIPMFDNGRSDWNCAPL